MKLQETELRTEMSLDSQMALKALGIHTFRYYPKEKCAVLSESMAEHFNYERYYDNVPESITDKFVFTKDREKSNRIFERILEGVDTVSETVRTRDGNRYYRLALSVIERDESGFPVSVGGALEFYDDHMRAVELSNVLSEDYQSMYFVDFIEDEVTPYRMAEFINNNYGANLTAKPKYGDVIAAYIRNEVVAEEQAMVLSMTSYENLSNYFSDESRKRFVYEFRVLRDGKPRFIRAKFVNLSEGKKLTRAVVGFADVDIERAEAWERLAYIDQLTGGWNYTFYSEQLKKESGSGYVVSADIKAFKLINSVCGISKGDDILRRISSIIDRAVCGRGFYGHLNADHFVFFLKVDSDEKVEEILREINESIADMVVEEDIPKISPYFGVTRWNAGMRSQVVLSEANTAKHRIKEHKEAFYGFFRKEDVERALEIKYIEDSFENAIKNKEFKIWYQPKFDPASLEMIGAEALVRWLRPDGTLVSPGKFIPIFESNGMILELDRYVFASVCEKQIEWEKKYGRIIPVSVNLSRASLYFNSIVEDYGSIADRIGIRPKFVPLEITESAAVGNGEIKELADRFYDAGFRLHIDDFGTGFSSLSTLNMMRFDTLKLDKSIIDYIGDRAGNVLLKHTVAMAKDLGLEVIAEGVEVSEQVGFLRELNCDGIQGFFFAKPMNENDFEDKLYERKLG